MNKILSIVVLFITSAILTGCNETTIEYTGTECVISDSVKVAYNTELASAYKSIDSATNAMLKDRGPKGSRTENEDIDDEYDGASEIAEKAKEYQLQVIHNKYCKTVDTYIMYGNSKPTIRLNEFEISPSDTAMFHEKKRLYFYGNKK
ncbi:MAG: hypothetical protein WC358_08565 [Ignavibacteria bacterium]|jgi:hypothetical protein